MKPIMELQGWVVVCEDFHGAVGLFKTEDQAKVLVAEMNSSGADGTGCHYRAIPAIVAIDQFLN